MHPNHKSDEENARACDGCSCCCENVNIIIDPPKTQKDIDRIRWYLLHGIFVFIEEDGTWKCEIPVSCEALNEKHRCSIYATRPDICRHYDQGDCERYGEGEYFVRRFQTADEFMSYIKDESAKDSKREARHI